MGFGGWNLFDCNDIAAVLLVSRHALGKAASAMGSGPGDHIRQQDREGLGADDLACAPDGVAEAEWRLLAGETCRAGCRKIRHERRVFGLFTASGERVFEFIGRVEMIFDHRLVAAGHENEMLDPRFACFIDHVLKNWPIDDGQHLLGNRLGRREKPRAETGDGQHGFTDGSVHGCLVPRSMGGERGGEPSEILISDYQFRLSRSTRLFSAEFVLGQSKKGLGMSVLVTGGAGYIGGHMALGLLDTGETVIVLDNLSTGFAWGVPEGAKLIVGDTGDTDLVARLIKEHAIDAVAHFATKIVVPESVRDPLGYYLNNVSNARSLIEAAVKGGVKTFIFSSTAAVYGETRSEPVSEETALAPISPYGRSKLMVEWMLDDASKAYDFRYVALRYFNVAGADPKGRLGQSTPNATHLIKRAVQTALGIHPKIEVFGEDYPTRDGTCVRDYIQVSDLIDAHLRALAYLRAGGASVVCNCGYGHGETVKEVVEVVKRVSGVDFPVEVSGRRAGDPAAIVAKADRARSVLGWKPTRDNLDDIVRQALDWERRLHNRRTDG